MILNALNLKESNSSFEIIDSDDEYIDYYNYRIKNDKSIKNQIDIFNININIPFDVFSKSNGYELSFGETIKTLNYILSRKELMGAINNSNATIYDNFNNIIETLFNRVIIIILEKCNSTDNIMQKCGHNVNLCQYSIYYRHVFNNKLNKSFENYYKSLTHRCFNIATNYGCIVSWLTFAKLAPEMVKDNCYPIINKNTIIYKNIIWDNIKDNKLFIEEIELFNKYHKD